MARTRPNDEKLASFCSTKDIGTVERIFSKAERKLKDLGRDEKDFEPFRETSTELGTFGEEGWGAWIDEIEPVHEEDIQALGRLVATCRRRLGHTAEPSSPDPTKAVEQVIPTTSDAVEALDQAIPTAFISYSWDSPEHKLWVKELARQLRADGVDVKLDQWETVPGDRLPEFMERAIRENDYVLIICTPNYKRKSDDREGGAGYEGGIITGELFTTRNERKFIPVLRSGTWLQSMPSWLGGKYGIDLSGNPYSEDEYQNLLTTLHNQREQPPPIGKEPQLRKSVREEAQVFYPTNERTDREFEPIKIKGVLVDQVGRPANDGTQGSALYTVPIQLSRRPTHEWCRVFIQLWDHPPRYSIRHRPGIATVWDDRIVLKGTTIEEVRDFHRDTLKLVVDAANTEIEQRTRGRRAAEEEAQRQEQQRQQDLRRIADDLTFD